MLGLVGISHCDKKPICINREETNCLVMKCLGGELSSQSNRGRVDAVPTYLLSRIDSSTNSRFRF